MANLSVNNKILRYKQTSYQISQITSAKPVETKRLKKKQEPISLQPLKVIIPLALLLVGIGYILLALDIIYGLIGWVIAAALFYYSFERFKEKNEQENSDPYLRMYGISLRISNGDDPVFMSSNKSIIDEVHSAILSAMNGDDNVSISFDNANIEITDSDNINIGNSN